MIFLSLRIFTNSYGLPVDVPMFQDPTLNLEAPFGTLTHPYPSQSSSIKDMTLNFLQTPTTLTQAITILK